MTDFKDRPLNPFAERFKGKEAVFSRGQCGPDITVTDKTGKVYRIRPEQIRFGVPQDGGEPTWLLFAAHADYTIDEDYEFILSEITVADAPDLREDCC